MGAGNFDLGELANQLFRSDTGFIRFDSHMSIDFGRISLQASTPTVPRHLVIYAPVDEGDLCTAYQLVIDICRNTVLKLSQPAKAFLLDVFGKLSSRSCASVPSSGE